MNLQARRWWVSVWALPFFLGCGNGHSSAFDNTPPPGTPGGPGDDSGASSTGDDGGDLTQGPGGNLVGPGGGPSDGGAEAATLPPTTTFVDNCTSNTTVPAAAVQALLKGGSSGSVQVLYPYPSTVFPRGLISPTVMWQGVTAQYVYVHLKSMAFEYKGCLAPTGMGQVQIPQDVWQAAGAHTSGAADPFTLSLTLISSSNAVTGPVTEPLIVAPATLKGSIFYNSYTTKLAQSAGPMGSGAVLRLTPGQNVQLFLGMNGCTGCHAVSANGSRMVADPFTMSIQGSGASYALTPGIAPNPSPLVANAPNGTFVGVYPDGSLYVGNAHPNGGFGGPRPGGPLATGPGDAGLFETDTGNAVPNSGIPGGAMMSMFSPDGTLLAFTDVAIGAGSAANNVGQGMATMSFNVKTRTATNYKQVYKVTDPSTYPGWPFFLPDDGALIFAVGNQNDYSGGGTGLGLAGGLASPATSDLYILDLASGTATLLSQALGYATVMGSNWPFPASDELHHNYDPTVSPVAAGGYFWIFFDSYRHYGNLGLQRQLWGAAIDVQASGKYAMDPSHPPFYLTGQELGTGNHRAFTALDPCHKDGSSCTTGVDCCGGFCTNGMCGLPKTPRCSNMDEMCSATQKCCDPRALCINGFCENPVN
ncbi:MAG TPA: hypothetical protein VKU41_19360 [Polyangiaceae bacterium]|nr:hypothetical protein [Polyangiaceae bacterium]